MKSKYLTFFTKLREQRPEFYKLFGSRILVEVLPDPELKTSGGLILASVKNQRTDTEENKFTAAVVIATGSGYFNEDGEDVPLSVKPGQVVEVVRSSLRRYSSHPVLGSQYSTGDLATTKESDISGIIAESVEEYEAALLTVGDLQSSIS